MRHARVAFCATILWEAKEAMAADIITPTALNERFTLYLNTEGKPVQRTLREMTAAEVLMALEWSRGETDQLSAEAEPARVLAVAIEEGCPPDDLTQDQFNEAVLILRRSGEAMNRDARLMSLVAASMPKWKGTGMPLAKALHRYWPGGRAA
jgi:hypothetical protein